MCLPEAIGPYTRQPGRRLARTKSDSPRPRRRAGCGCAPRIVHNLNNGSHSVLGGNHNWHDTKARLEHLEDGIRPKHFGAPEQELATANMRNSNTATPAATATESQAQERSQTPHPGNGHPRGPQWPCGPPAPTSTQRARVKDQSVGSVGGPEDRRGVRISPYDTLGNYKGN